MCMLFPKEVLRLGSCILNSFIVPLDKSPGKVGVGTSAALPFPQEEATDGRFHLTELQGWA